MPFLWVSWSFQGVPGKRVSGEFQGIWAVFKGFQGCSCGFNEQVRGFQGVSWVFHKVSDSERSRALLVSGRPRSIPGDLRELHIWDLYKGQGRSKELNKNS